MRKRNLVCRKRQKMRQVVGASVLSVSLALTSGTAVLAEEPLVDAGQQVSTGEVQLEGEAQQPEEAPVTEEVTEEVTAEEAEAAQEAETEAAAVPEESGIAVENETENDYEGWDTLTVFETTDVHGYITDVSTYKEETFQYRLAYISNIVNQTRDEEGEENVILLDSGDIYQSTPHSNLTYGNYLRAAFDAMGYDAVGLGNHEFDWDVTKYAADLDGTMASYVTNATGEVNPTIPVVMSNLYYAGTDNRVNFTQDYTVVEKGGYKVAIVGWADEYSSDIKASQIAPYKIDGNLESLKAETKKVKEETDADILIVLAHGSPDAIAEAVDPDVVDLVCGGHSHKSIVGTAKNGVDYIQGNCKAQGYATAEIKVDPETKEVDVINPTYTHITSKDNLDNLYYKDGTNTLLDSKIVQISQEAWDAVKDDMYEVLATADQSITKDVLDGSIVTSSAGNWITGLMLAATKDQNTVAAFANSGGIRTSLVTADGETTRDITVADVYTISPFGNRLLTYAITGKQMATQIENAIRFDSEDNVVYNYTNFGDQFSGITVTYEKQGNRIKVLSIVTDDGEIIDVNDETKTYNVVANEYCATLSYTDPDTNEVTDSVFKNLTPLVALDDAPVDNLSAIEALRARRDSEGLAMKVDTTARLKADTGEAAAYEQMKNLMNKADQYNKDNVTQENKAELEQLIKNMETLLADGKLTDAQAALLESKKQEVQTLLDGLTAKTEEKKEEKKPEETSVKKAQEEKKTDKVKTGDAGTMLLWLLMLGAAGSTGIAVSVSKMRRKSNVK